MKLRAVQWLWLLALALILNFVSGCASTESENESVRPWNMPADWQTGGALGNMDYQHR
jgi:hypothetical protein